MKKLSITKEELESVYYLQKELAMWEKRKEELEADIALSGIASDGMPHGNSVGSPTERKAIKLMETATVIEGKKTEIKLTIADIEKFIMNIDDPKIRMIIEYRCTMCMKWEDIGKLLSYDRTTVAKMYKDFIDATFPQFPRRKQ